MDRLLQQKDVIRAIDEHTTADGKLDNDITCILEDIRAALIDDIGIPLEPPKKKRDCSSSKITILSWSSVAINITYHSLMMKASSVEK